ncbi:MAG: DNA helicase RecQ [Candidatus Symbiothrix sp.]|jgi:ATP-dependent DNA helicase RecQ|nr:DNA helicase RecQ [Candidatus Symbiothrix sp.]
MSTTIEKKLEVLKKYFGYSAFRPNQAEIVDSILAHRDCLAVMPTGAGKSICFQLPAMLFPGITIVISPLISLMNDQIRSLRQSGISAAYLNSSQSNSEQYDILNRAKSNEYQLLYVAPERLDEVVFLEYAKNADIAMVTVDEAHCISQWGQDFRPAYSKIPVFIAQLKNRPVVSAFTATATQRVREDILHSLQLDNPKIVVAGFDRKNLLFEVKTPTDKNKTVLDLIKKHPNDYGIVYCSTRKNVEEVVAKLKTNGIKAAPYHAGFSAQERTQNQEDFLFDKINVIVATNAFGMGIDKSNVSYVIHYNMPKDIESYYQEAGRAGRDGSQAECTLLFSGQDVVMGLWLIENSSDNDSDKEEIDAKLKEELRMKARERLRAMERYCKTNDCLRAYILNYFGEPDDLHENCGACSNCNNPNEVVDITILAQKILSCIYKMYPKVGRGLVIDTLRGSKNEKVMNKGFYKLSTYNICTESVQELGEVFDFLVENGYIQMVGEQYPVCHLTTKANEILRERKSLSMKQNLVTKAERKEKEYVTRFKKEHIVRDVAVYYNVNDQLLTQLKKLRRQIADNQGVPAFQIFQDSSLVDMCRILPKTADEFSMVSGVGAYKQQRYAAAFTKLITDFTSHNSVEKTTETGLALTAN